MYEYLNLHRPCGFVKKTIFSKGKISKKYETYLTPYEKLISIPNYEIYLKEGISKEGLHKYSLRQSDNNCAKKMQVEKQRLSEKLRKLQK